MTEFAALIAAAVLGGALWLGWVVDDEGRTDRVRRWLEGDRSDD